MFSKIKNVMTNLTVNNPAVLKAAKDIPIHFSVGFASAYFGHKTGDKYAKKQEDNKNDPTKKHKLNISN